MNSNFNSRPQVEKRIFKSERKNIEGQFETFEKTLREILKESEEKTVIIISDSAGTGKTSTLHEINRILRENDSTRWTIRTELKKHIEMFKTIQGEDFKSFEGFCTQIILADKSSFEKTLFTQFYKEGRTNILLDGFDEISPHYKEEVLSALKLFTSKSGNQLWITTRSHLKLELEKTLDQLSCSLQPLTRKAQIEFLENIWKSDTGANLEDSNSQEDLSIIAEGLVNKLSSFCDARSSFIGLPILISMVAEIFHENLMQIETLTFYAVFKQFVSKKIDISNEKGEIAEEERKEILLQSEGIMEVHRRIAIAHFFGEEIEDVDVDYDDEEWTVEKLTRLGLIRYDESRKSLSFIHETFAEFFLTDFIVGNLRTKTRARGAVKILAKVLTEKDFQVVRLFLDQALKEPNFICDKKLCETVGKQFNVLREETCSVLSLISKESCEEVLKFMLHTIEHVEEPVKVINERDEEGNNALLINIAVSRKTMIQTIFDFISQNSRIEIAKMTVQALNAFSENVFHLATNNKNEEIFPTLHECMQEILTTEEIKEMMRARNKDKDEWSVLQWAASFCNESALNDLFGYLKELFSDEEMKEMLFDVNRDGNNSLHVAAQWNNKTAMKCFFKHLNKTFYHDESKKLIQHRGFEQRNVFHSASGNKNEEIFPTLYEYAINYFDDEEIKKMLKAKDVNEWNILHYAAASGNESALNGLFGTLEGLFSDEETKEMFFDVNKDGNNSLHVAAQWNNRTSLKCFFKHLIKTLGHDDSKKLIQKGGFLQGNIFHPACDNKNEEIFSTLHECLQEILTTEEIKKMLKAKDVNERNVLHCAAESSNESALNGLFGNLKEIFSDEEVEEMLFQVNKDGENSLHLAARLNTKIALNCFLKHSNEILDHDDSRRLFQQTGYLQRHIFHPACENKNDEIFSTLHECTSKFLDNDEIKIMLKEKDKNEWKVLHYAAAFGNESALNDLFVNLKKLFSDEEMKEMLLEINSGSNSLHVATQWNNKTALKCFLKNSKEILDHEETRRLFQERRFLQRNIFHVACENKNEEIFATLQEYAINFFGEHEIRKMLEEKSEDEKSVLQLATELCNENAMNDLMQVLKELSK